jgi:hypothetical protein
MGHSQRSKALTKSRLAELEAINLRKAGLTYENIGKELGYTPQGAWKLVKRALNRVILKTMENAEEYRQVELQRLDELWSSVYPLALKGHLKSVETCLKIMQRRAKLLGLDAPQAIDVIEEKHVTVSVVYEGRDKGNGNSQRPS